MEREDRDLLFKDLCMRLPYRTKIQLTEYSELTGEKLPSETRILDYYTLGKVQAYCRGVRKDEVRPYLFPMSSMTDEQIDELKDLCDMYDPVNDNDNYEDWGTCLMTKHFMEDEYHFKFNFKLFEFLNKNRFDYRSLIPLGLAIDATNLNIY